MNSFVNMLKSSVGYKFLMALTGIGLFGFVLMHLLGNLQIFLGPETFNHYAHLLKSMKGPLWAARIGLLVIVALHIFVAFQLRERNNSARPIPYGRDEALEATLPARYMFVTGIMVLAFIVYHLLHFTVGVIYPGYFVSVDPNGGHDVYTMVIRGLQHPLVALSYMVAVTLLGVHLSHGFSSIFRSLGISRPDLNEKLEKLGVVVATLIALGYLSIPLSVLTGIVTLKEKLPQ